MKVRPDRSISPAEVSGGAASPGVAAGGAPLAKTSAVPAEATDAARISSASAALDQSGKIEQLAALVQAGAYETSSAGATHALIEDALSGHN